MDTSKEYQLMCLNAEEIQILRDNRENWTEVDYYSNNKVVYLFSTNIFAKFPVIWIPRQDQLQELFNESFFDLVYFGWRDDKEMSSIYWNNNSSDWHKEVRTPERLWLCWIMLNKFNKIWDGISKTWINKK